MTGRQITTIGERIRVAITYDSSEVRRAARQVRASLDKLAQAQPKVSRMRSDVSAEFQHGKPIYFAMVQRDSI